MIREAFKALTGGAGLSSRVLRWSVVSIAIYAFLGFLVAPIVAKWQLTKLLKEQLARDVTIEKLSINPFALSIRVRGFLLKEPSGIGPAVRFEELYLNLSSMSLFRLAPVLDEIRLVRPVIRIVRNADKSYNYTDLIQKFTASPAPPGPPPGPPPRFSLNNIELVDGQIEFDDKPEGKQHVISEIHIGIPFISSLPYATDINVEPAFSAKVNGTPFLLKGETKPFKDTRETTLKLELDDLDLTPYADYSPVPLGFRLQQGTLGTDLTVSLTTREGLLDTLVLSASAALKKLRVANNDDLALAGFDSLESDARFTLTRHGTTQEMIVSGVSAALRGLRVEDASRRAPLLEVGEIKLADTGADLGARNLTVGELTIDKANIQLARYRDGSFSFKRLIAFAAPGAAKSGNKPTAEAPWVVALKHFTVKNAAATFNDQLPATPAKLALTAVEIESENLSTAAKARGSLRVAATLNKRGRVEAAGALGLSPPGGEFNVTIKDIALAPFQPYVEDSVNVAITQGAVASRGQAVFSSSDSGPFKIAFRGDVSVHHFVSLEKPSDQELLTWKTLSLTGIDFGSTPLKIGVKEIAFSDFYSRLIVNSDGTLNLQTLMRKTGAPQEPAAAETPAPGPETPGSSTKPAPEMHVGKITFARGNVNYSDYFVKPNVSANLTNITGGVSEMTADTVGDVTLSGEVNGTSPIDVNGRINPFAKDLFLNLNVNAQDIELSPMSPYTIKYASYGIEKGKLSLRLKYLVEHRKLTAENNIYLDQLTFGDKVESPTAMKLPILLAVSLLKDRNGVIDVTLPVSGSLDDPKFSIGRVILQVLGNLIMKAVTSPFALLGAAFGGGEELAFVDFAPGRATLTPEAETKLKTLAKALSDRPALKMDIAGRIDPEPDREGLKHASVERKIKTQKLKATAGSGTPADSVDAVVIEPGEYEQYLTAAYKAEKFPKPRNFIGIAKSLPVPEMEQLMFTNAQATDEDLRLLANQRAQAVKDWLMQAGQVSAERLFLTAPRTGAENSKDKGSLMRADFTLK